MDGFHCSVAPVGMLCVLVAVPCHS